MEGKRATIKGMFLQSHVRVLREKKSEQGAKQLRECYGKPLTFSGLQEIPVSEEVRLVHCILNILRPGVPIWKQECESGITCVIE